MRLTYLDHPILYRVVTKKTDKSDDRTGNMDDGADRNWKQDEASCLHRSTDSVHNHSCSTPAHK